MGVRLNHIFAKRKYIIRLLPYIISRKRYIISIVSIKMPKRCVIPSFVQDSVIVVSYFCSSRKPGYNKI